MGAFSRKRLRERFITFAGAVYNVCIRGCKRYPWRTHVFAFKVDQIGPGGCSVLQGRMQCTASEMGNTGTEIVSPILDKRKGRRDTPHMGHSSPLIYLLSRENPCGWSSDLHPESVISVMKKPMDMVQSVHTALWKRLSVRTTR